LNDFGRDIKGLRAVLKPINYYKKPSTVAERTLKILSGSGCKPEPEWSRNIEVKGPDGLIETISSYDLEYVIDTGGNKIAPHKPEAADAYVCTATPTGPVEEANKVVRRKR